MKFKVLGALVAVLAAVGVLFAGQPSLDQQLAKIEPGLDAKLAAREVQIDPGELLDLVYNDNVALKIIDLRDERDYNLFHLIDAERATMEQVRDHEWVKRLPKKTVIVLVSNDEARATAAWKLLTTQKVANLYLLAGGANFWLDLYGDEHALPEPANAPIPPPGDDALRHPFTFALGANHPASNPDPHHAPKRNYTPKVKSIGSGKRKSGGCG